MKEIRRPWVPMVQARGCEAGSKFVRRVTAHSSVGSSRVVMGWKRVSSKALESQLGYTDSERHLAE